MVSTHLRTMKILPAILLVVGGFFLVFVAFPGDARASQWYDIAEPAYASNWQDIGAGCCGGQWYDIAEPSYYSGQWYDIAEPSYGSNWQDIGAGCCGGQWYDIAEPSYYSGQWYDIAEPVYDNYNYYPSTSSYNSYNYYPSTDYSVYASYSSPSYAYYQPQQPIYHTPSSNYSYYNNVESTVHNNIDNSVVTNTNINTNTTPTYYPSYPTYYPPVQYSYPRVVQAPTVTVSGTRYVHINQVPYTGVNEIAYMLMLIAVALAAGVAFFFREQLIGGLRNAYATATGRNDHFFFDEAPEEANDDVIDLGDTQDGSNSLAIVRSADGPKLSFVQR